jgi:two-component system chemotaxis response regulator CheB
MVGREAANGDRLQPGTIYIAPGSHHMKIVRQGVDLVVRLDDGRKVSGHRPSADVMLGSLAKACGPRAVGVIMTGMGEDGAKGLSMMHRAGAWTIAQDEPTSLVYGMPKAAAETGDCDHILALDRIPLAVSNLMGRGARATAAAT